VTEYSEDRQRRLRMVLRAVSFGGGLLTGLGIAAFVAGETSGDPRYRGFWIVITLTALSSLITAVLALRAVEQGHPQARRIVTISGGVVTLTGLVLIPGFGIVAILVLAVGISLLLLARLSDVEDAT
jgi:hypothetical protein